MTLKTGQVPVFTWPRWAMRADTLRARWVGLLLAAAVLTAGCTSLTPPPGRGRNLGYTPRVEAEPAVEEPQRLHRRRELREGVGPGSTAPDEPERQRVTLARQALLGAIEEAAGATGHVAAALPPLGASRTGLGGGANGVFSRYLVHGSNQLRWLRGALGGATTLAHAASQVADPDLELALLRMSGPRLQAAMSGALLLAAWLDFLNLADAVLRQCPYYGAERLFMDLERVQKLIEPSMTALASLEPGQVEATAVALPSLMGQLTREFQAIREAARVATERGGQFMAAAQFVEMLTLISTMKLSLPRLPPAAPVTLGVGLVMGSNGVMMGSRLVVTAEWVERMRRLVQAGVITVSAASAAVRIHAGQVMMSQANPRLPQGVRDALGDGPEVSAMHETGKAGAGMAERPKHHVMPDEHRGWFEQRGFTGAMDIDQFCVRLETARHQALHGGGNWRLGRMWPGEWNQMIMKALRDAETRTGRRLTQSEILKLVAEYMKLYDIPMNFTRWRGR